MMKRIFVVLFLLFIAVSLKAYILEPKVINGVDYVPMSDICEVFGLTIDPTFYPERIVLRSSNETIVLLAFSTRMFVSGKVFMLESAPKFENSMFLLPVSFIGKAFGQKAIDTFKNKECRIKTIIVDAGHGGHDPGAIGHNGLMEKEVNLDIAYKLTQLLNSNLPVRVFMTRTDDTFVTLSDRAKFANSKGADLFISIHNNAAFADKMKGSETFFVSVASDPSARAVEVLENSVINLEFKESKIKGTNAQDILQDMAYFEFVRESSLAASCVQKNLVKTLALEDRGVKQALFYVLRMVAMPSILVEVAFLTCLDEEGKLASEDFRQKAAESIYNGVREYLMAGIIKR